LEGQITPLSCAALGEGVTEDEGDAEPHVCVETEVEAEEPEPREPLAWPGFS